MNHLNILSFQLELRKMLLDRMINLLTRGCVVPVVKYIKLCSQKGDTDTSLIRYFVTEVNLVNFISSFGIIMSHNVLLIKIIGSRNYHTSIFTGIRATLFAAGRKRRDYGLNAK